MGIFNVEEPPETPEKEELAPAGQGIELLCEDKKQNVTADTKINYNVKVINTGKAKDSISIAVDLIYKQVLGEEAPEWDIKLKVKAIQVDENSFGKKTLTAGFDLKSGDEKWINVEVNVPKGLKYGDRVEAIMNATSSKDPAISNTITLTTIARQGIYAVKTAIGHERDVADSIAGRSTRQDIGVFSVLCPAKLRGYVLVEAMNPERLYEVVKGIRKARGMVEGETSFEEIDHFLTPKPLVADIMDGDIVELIQGPFKGEKARVQKIDENKEEITVELFEAMVPIPVTVKGDSVRVLEKDRRHE